MAPPSKIFRHSLSQLLGTSLYGTGDYSAGSQNPESMQLLSEGDSRSNESYLRLHHTQDEENETTEGQLMLSQGHTMSQDMQPANESVTEGYSQSNEGHSRLNDGRCVNCGCIRHTTMEADNTLTSNHVVVGSELGQTQGSEATAQSRCGGHGTVDERQGRGSSSEPRQGSANVTRGSVAERELRCGGRHWSQVFDLKSYDGVVSRELCHQLVQLLDELDSAKDLNVQVSVIFVNEN